MTKEEFDKIDAQLLHAEGTMFNDGTVGVVLKDTRTGKPVFKFVVSQEFIPYAMRPTDEQMLCGIRPFPPRMGKV